MASTVELESMIIDLLGNSAEFDQMIDRAVRDARNFAREIENQGDRAAASFERSMQRMGSAVTSFGQVLGIMGASITALSTGGLFASLMPAGQFEQTVIAFETMIGSAEETQKTLADLTEFAALTPFEMPEIEQAARGLIQFGERGEELMETLNIIGNAASGTNTRFGDLALIFNQVRGVGKLLTQDFRQMSTRGILSLQDIANHFNVTTEAAQGMLSNGKISFEDLEAILGSLSEEGGRFFKLMEKQSKSFLGLISTLKDAVGLLLRDFGTELMPIAKGLTTQILQIAESLRNMSPAVKKILAVALPLGLAFGAAATAAGGVLMAVGMMMPAITAIVGLVGSISGPVLAIGAGVAAIGTALAVTVGYLVDWSSLWDSAKERASSLADFVVGFLSNFQQNTTILKDYFIDNWREMVVQSIQNVVRLGQSIVKVVPSAFRQAVTATIKLGMLLNDALGEMMDQTFEYIWKVNWPATVNAGMYMALQKIVDFRKNMLQALVEGVMGSVEAGGAEGGLKERLAAIAEEAWAGIEMPEFKPEFDLPELGLNLEIPKTEKMAEGVKKTGEEAEKARGGIGEMTKEMKKAQQQAESMIRSIETPMERFTRKRNELMQVVSRGGFKGEEQKAMRVLASLEKEYQSALEKTKEKVSEVHQAQMRAREEAVRRSEQLKSRLNQNDVDVSRVGLEMDIAKMRRARGMKSQTDIAFTPVNQFAPDNRRPLQPQRPDPEVVKWRHDLLVVLQQVASNTKKDLSNDPEQVTGILDS